MRRFASAVVIAAVALSVGAGAGAESGRQRVAIKWNGPTGFSLTPLTPGELKSDTGSATFCCWRTRVIVQDGQKTERGEPEMILVGKRGKLIAHNRLAFADVRGGYSVFTGTWNVVRGTGAYAGLVGGGRVAGIVFPGGDARWQREGLVGRK